MRLKIYAEICCEYCNDIIHNHFDCPSCGNHYTPSDQYIGLEEYSGDCSLTCEECGAEYHTSDRNPYSVEAEWERVCQSK